MGTLRAVGLIIACCLFPVVGAQDAWAAVGVVLPLEGPVVRRFDPPAQPWLAGHRGVDLRGSPGAAVASAMAGRVVFAGTVAGRAVVVVSHGDLRTTYLPVRAGVAVGATVSAGQVIGRLLAGHPCPGGTCLHWGLKRGETYLDPLSLLDAGGVRLLPSASVDLAARAGFPAATDFVPAVVADGRRRPGSWVIA